VNNIANTLPSYASPSYARASRIDGAVSRGVRLASYPARRVIGRLFRLYRGIELDQENFCEIFLEVKKRYTGRPSSVNFGGISAKFLL